jgi:hypothetical protein
MLHSRCSMLRVWASSFLLCTSHGVKAIFHCCMQICTDVYWDACLCKTCLRACIQNCLYPYLLMCMHAKMFCKRSPSRPCWWGFWPRAVTRTSPDGPLPMTPHAPGGTGIRDKQRAGQKPRLTPLAAVERLPNRDSMC